MGFFFVKIADMIRQLSQINIYPIKSLDGFSPRSAFAEEKGLQYDRRWMLVDEFGVFLSQRVCKKMCTLRAEIENNQLRVFAKDNPGHFLSVSTEEEGVALKVKVWDDEVEALKVNEAADQFFTEILGLKCSLVKMPERSKRPIDMAFNKGSEYVSFADGFPYLIVGEASLTDLNSRLAAPIPELARRFRPNFVFTGIEAYEEDNWKAISIGNVQFSGKKNCGRCVMTTLDPDSGQSNSEPLSTLSGYRKRGNSVVFGQNLCLLTPSSNVQELAEVAVGDPVEILL